MTILASLVLYAADLDRTTDFFRAVGVPLEHEDHDDGPAHAAAELGATHFAIYASPGREDRRAPGRRETGSAFPGFYVPSLDTARAAVHEIGAPLLEDHDQLPWGCRIVAEDPDGRAVEIIQRDHCGRT